MAVLINANAMCWALAAGLLASAWSKAWLRALLGAAPSGLVLSSCCSPTRSGWFLVLIFRAHATGSVRVELGRNVLGGRVQLRSSDQAGVRARFPAVGSGRPTSCRCSGKATLFSLLVLLVAVLAAGAKTRRSWQEEPPSRRQALVAADLLHAGSVAGLLSPLDAPEAGAQSDRLAGTAHLEREAGDLGVVCGADFDLQPGVD